ncbi:hypothetical protein PENTCL1PPCAC_26035, partial [Pristionchus entomophagus]
FISLSFISLVSSKNIEKSIGSFRKSHLLLVRARVIAEPKVGVAPFLDVLKPAFGRGGDPWVEEKEEAGSFTLISRPFFFLSGFGRLAAIREGAIG